MALTSVAARRLALPSCRRLKALSSRFSDSGCPGSEGIRLSGERVITRVDSFQSTSPSSPLGRTPRTPSTVSMFNFSANHLLLLSRTEYRSCAVLVMRDDSTRRVYRLHDFSKSHILTPGQ